MPRRKKTPIAIADTLEALKEQMPALQTAVELAPPEREIVEPEPNRPRSLSEKVRPSGPRKRDGEPATSFASDELRIIKDGHMWQVEARRDLTGAEKDKLAASGFTAVDDAEQVWNASQRDLASRGTDINIVAMELGKPAIAGRGR